MVSKKRKKIILILISILVFYFFIPVPIVTKNQEVSIQEKALTVLYNQQEYGPKEQIQIFYVEIGKGKLFDPFFDPDDGTYILTTEDPSDQLINKLQLWPNKVKPASGYRPADPNDIVVHNEQHERGIFLSVGPIIKSMGLARCRTYYYGGGLCSAEYETFLIWTPLGWKHLFNFRLWSS